MGLVIQQRCTVLELNRDLVPANAAGVRFWCSWYCTMIGCTAQACTATNMSFDEGM
jgi:hypothetical protein